LGDLISPVQDLALADWLGLNNSGWEGFSLHGKNFMI
jgi:hypothetical protein